MYIYLCTYTVTLYNRGFTSNVCPLLFSHSHLLVEPLERTNAEERLIACTSTFPLVMFLRKGPCPTAFTCKCTTIC